MERSNQNEAAAPRDPNSAPPRPRRRWRLGLLIAFVMLAAAFVAFRVTVAQKVERRLSELRAAGYPILGHEVEAWYPSVPDEENGALVMIAGADLIVKPDEDEREKSLWPLVSIELPEVADPIGPEMLELMRTTLEDNEDALELVRQGAAMPRSRYPVELSRGLIPDPLERKDALEKYVAELLEIDALYRLEGGDVTGAVADIRAILGLARSFEHEPTTISYLQAIGARSAAAQATAHVLTRASCEPPLLEELSAMWKPDIDSTDRFAKAVAGERATVGLYFFDPDTMARGGEDERTVRGWRGIWVAYGWPGLMDLDRLNFLDAMQRYVDAAHEPFPARIKAFSDVGREVAERTPPYAFLSRVLLHDMGRLATIDAMGLANQRMVETAFAIERFRIANGRLPERLDKLVPTFLPVLPSDPFTTDSLRYRTLETGYIIYSVGEDGTDDGGAKQEDFSSNDPYDLPFAVAR